MVGKRGHRFYRMPSLDSLRRAVKHIGEKEAFMPNHRYRVTEVDAHQVPAGTEERFNDEHDKLHVAPVGHWVVRRPDGTMREYSEKEFNDEFEAIAASSKKEKK